MAVTVASSNVANTGTTTLVITKPTGLASGDLMVAFIGGKNDGGTINTPSGWTQAQSSGSASTLIKIVYKVADSTDAAASDFTFTRTNNSRFTGVLMRVTGQDTTTPVDTSGSNSDSGGSTITITTLTPSKANSLFMLGGSVDTFNDGNFAYSTATDNPTWTEVQNTGLSVGNESACAWAVRSSSAATGSIIFDPGQAFNDGSAAVIIIKPLGTNYPMTASYGSFTLTGYAANLLRAIRMTASQGSYTLTGYATNLKRGYGIIASYGSYVLTGYSANFTKAIRMIASYGSYTLTGFSTAFSKGISMVAETGSYIYTGFSAGLRRLGWRNETKNYATWSNNTKSTSTWTNENKSVN